MTAIAPQTIQESLNTQHYQECVERRGLDREWVLANCRSVTANEATQKLGYTAKSDGIWLEGCNHQSQYKPDKAWKSEGDKKAPKYRSPLGEYDAMLPNHPTDSHYWNDIEALKQRAFQIDGHPCLKLTEGFFKSLASCANGIPTIGLLGVEMGLTPGSADLQGKRYLVPTLERYAKAGFGFIIGFDADCATNKAVIEAQRKLAHQLKLFKVPIYSITGLWTVDQGKGIDDYIQNNGSKRFIREVLGKAVDITAWEKQFQNSSAAPKAKTERPTPQFVAQQIDERYRIRWAYHCEQKVWRVFNDKVWKAVDDEAFGQMVLHAIEAQGVEYRTDSFIENVAKILKRKLLVPEWVTFDRKDWIAFSNCVLEVATGKQHPHSPGFRFVSHLERNYQPLVALQPETSVIQQLQASCPHFYKWAMAAMDGDPQRVLKLLAIVNAVLKFRFFDLQMFVHLVGKPGTGKGTFARLLQKLVGEENCEASRLGKLGDDYELARIINAQVVVCPDEDKQVGNHGGLKALTGGDRVSYRQIYKTGAKSFFYGLIVICSNSPIFCGDTTGLDRRLCLLSFQNQIPASRRNSGIEDLLETELSALTSVALSMPDIQVTEVLRGLGAAEIPEFKRQEWELKIQSNSVASWLNEQLIHDATAKTQVGNLFGAYTTYCTESGLKPFSLTSFSPNLLQLCNEHLGWDDVIKVRSGSGVYIKGLRLRQVGIDDEIPCQEQMFEIESPSVGLSLHSVDHDVELKPAQNKGYVGYVGLESNFLKSAQSHSKVGQNNPTPDAIPSISENVEPQPYIPTQASQDKGFNPTSGSTHDPTPIQQTELGFSTSAVPLQAGEPVEVYIASNWEPALLLECPNDHPDPTRRKSGWKVRLLQSEMERYVWDQTELRSDRHDPSL